MSEDYDFFADTGEESGSSEAFKNKVTALVRRVRTLEDEMDKLAQQNKVLLAEKEDLERRQIPDALTEAGVSEFTTLEGLKVSTKFIVGSIPNETKNKAFEWLDSHGHSDIIKRAVEVKFDKGSTDAAEKAAQSMREMGFDPKVTLSVHAQTFMSFAREQINKGKMLPLDEWGVYYGNRAVIK